MAPSCCPGSCGEREIFPKATLKPSFPSRSGWCSGVTEIPQLSCVMSPAYTWGHMWWWIYIYIKIFYNEKYFIFYNYIQRLARINLVPHSLVEETSMGWDLVAGVLKLFKRFKRAYFTYLLQISEDMRQPSWAWSYTTEKWDLLIGCKVRLFMNLATDSKWCNACSVWSF